MRIEIDLFLAFVSLEMEKIDASEIINSGN